MLSARKVEISRAVWFVRAFGGVEIVGFHVSPSSFPLFADLLSDCSSRAAIPREIKASADSHFSVHFRVHDGRLRIYSQTTPRPMSPRYRGSRCTRPEPQSYEDYVCRPQLEYCRTECLE